MSFGARAAPVARSRRGDWANRRRLPEGRRWAEPAVGGHPLLAIDNNAAELEIKRIAIGRKNSGLDGKRLGGQAAEEVYEAFTPPRASAWASSRGRICKTCWGACRRRRPVNRATSLPDHWQTGGPGQRPLMLFGLAGERPGWPAGSSPRPQIGLFNRL